MSIHYLNARAGAGKTRALVHYADRLAQRGSKVLIVQPTKHLIDLTIADELEPLAPRYPFAAIHGGAALRASSVVGKIVEHFQTARPDEGEVLFITHAAFFRLPYLHRKSDWVLLMDEAPVVDVFEALNLPETHSLITDHLELVPGGPSYGRLVSRERLAAIAADATGEDE